MLFFEGDFGFSDMQSVVIVAEVGISTLTKSHAAEEISMLILTRRVDETFLISDDISVTVLGIQGNQVRVGVAAPRDVEVHREEIYYRIHPDLVSSGKRRRDA